MTSLTDIESIETCRGEQMHKSQSSCVCSSNGDEVHGTENDRLVTVQKFI